MSFWCLQIPKKPTKSYLKISAWPLKGGQIRKKGTLYHWLEDFILTILHYLCIWIDLFLEARAKILLCFFGRFEVTQKNILKLTDLYLAQKKRQLFWIFLPYFWIKPDSKDVISIKLTIDPSSINRQQWHRSLWRS